MIWLVRTLLSLLFLGAGWEVYYQWRALEISITASELQDLHEAIRSDPEAPDYYFQLGLIHRDEPEHLDLSASRNYLEKALALNPHNWRYWLEAARCYEFSSLPAEAENAYLKAVSLNPRSAAYRWRLANFYLRSRKLPEALEQLNLTIDLDSSYRLPTLALLWKAEFESGQIETIWPGDLESQLILLSYLVTESAQEGGRPATDFLTLRWNKLRDGLEFPSVSQGVFYINHLLRLGHYQEARAEWIHLAQRNGMEDKAFASQENFIWNGGFEIPITDTALDWSLPSSQAFYIARAEKEGVNGTVALRIDFQGNENLDFHGLKQELLAEPGKTYSFSSQIKSEGIGTEQGVYFRISDPATGTLLLETTPVLGTTPWTQYSGSFRTSRDAHGVSIELRRRPSRRIDNLLRGNVWLDSVVLRAQASKFSGMVN